MCSPSCIADAQISEQKSLTDGRIILVHNRAFRWPPQAIADPGREHHRPAPSTKPRPEASAGTSSFRYCVLSSINYKLNRKHAAKRSPEPCLNRRPEGRRGQMPSLPSSHPPLSTSKERQGVSPRFHCEFKLHAVQHGMSANPLQESFRLMKERRAK
jgi:hypothetical protein